MRILDYLTAEDVIVGPSPHDKEATLRLLVDFSARRRFVENADALLAAIKHREEVVSTGLGNGVAVPHADLPDVSVPRLALGVFSEGVDFEALDEEPVYVVFLLIGTSRSPGLHMRILARIARLSKAPDFCASLRRAHTPADVITALERLEASRWGEMS